MLNKKLFLTLIAFMVLSLSGIMTLPIEVNAYFSTFPTSAACTASGGVMGDLNHDSIINNYDGKVINEILAGTEPYNACADLNLDGLIGPDDRLYLNFLISDIQSGQVIPPTAELWQYSFYNPDRLPRCQTTFGDINGDSKADYQDSNIITEMISQIIPYSACADIDGDGNIGPGDMARNRTIEAGAGNQLTFLEKPVITLMGNNPQIIEVNTSYIELGATANDTQDGDLTSLINVNISNLNINKIDTYYVYYNVIDSDGNKAIEARRTVKVVDTTAPVITLNGANPLAIAKGSAYIELGAVATDNYDPVTAVTNIDSSAVNTNVLGTYIVTYNHTDSSGNAAVQVTRTVNVLSTSTGGGGGGSGDVTPPTDLSLVINNGAQTTNNRNVNLAIGATDANYMMISNYSDFSSAVWEAFVTSKSWQLLEGYGRKTVYAKFKDNAGNVSTSISASITLVPPQVPEGEVLGERYVAVGTLVKRADISSVYFIGADNRRHAFPNETVFLSYYPDFSKVLTVSAETLADIPLGSNVTMNPGTWLVKIQSDPKVYAVEPSGVLRWITSEQIASGLYGNNWNTKVVDIDPTFFVNYQIGPEINNVSYPTGQLISYQGSDIVYYLDQGKKRIVSPGVFQNNNYQNKFVIKNVPVSIAYEDGEAMPSLGMEDVIALR